MAAISSPPSVDATIPTRLPARSPTFSILAGFAGLAADLSFLASAFGLARALGFARVTCSHAADPAIGFVARGDTTTVDAYLTPLLAGYLAGLREHLPGSSLLLMQSGGGLCDPELLRGQNAILSGPAGGVVACARLAQRAG